MLVEITLYKFILMIVGGAYLSGITYTTLKKESNYFETEKLKLIDADYAAATIFRHDCRVGELYVYGYGYGIWWWLEMVPIQQIESVQVKYWRTRSPGYMLIMNKHNGARSKIWFSKRKQDALQVANQIVKRNPGIIMK